MRISDWSSDVCSSDLSERRSCAVLTFDRRTLRYRSVRADQTPLIMRIRDIAQTRMRYGYFRRYSLLCRARWIVNHKRVHRLYRENRLSLRIKRPRHPVSAAPCERRARGGGHRRRSVLQEKNG